MIFTKNDMVEFARYYLLNSNRVNDMHVELEKWIKKVKTLKDANYDIATGLNKLITGTKPCDLEKEEINSLNKFHPDWFEKLGYSEPNYKRPKL